MSQNIKNNYTKQTDSKLYNAHYYDYMIYKGEVINQGVPVPIADFCDFNVIDGKIYSTSTWADAISGGVELEDIGLTGVDNGFIKFRKDAISNEEFLNIYLNSTYTIESGDTRFFMTPVVGNTQLYNYPLELSDDGDEKYLSCKGGFLQGFFKLAGFDYKVLPDHLENDMMFHFEIRPRTDYGVGDDTVNHIHPENNGIFFYIGTRAENKFWPFYKTSSAVTESMKKDDAVTEGYFAGCGEESAETYDLESKVIYETEWLKKEDEATHINVGDSYFEDDGYFAGDEVLKPCSSSVVLGMTPTYIHTYDFNSDSNCCHSSGSPVPPSCDDYFIDDYFVEDKCTVDNGKAIEDAYMLNDISIDTNSLTTSDGHNLNKNGYYEIETDNKFLLFDRTPSGFTVDNWEEGTKVVFEGRKAWPNINYFLIMNRTETGYTVDTIDQYNEANGVDYNLYKDIRNNAFALKITDDGAIGYRYGMLDCEDEENESKYKVVEEYSKPGLVKMNDWNSINIRFVPIPAPRSKCDRRPDKMKIMIYVNGFLIFISKELLAFNFKDLDDDYTKQEGVPYNISLGGGTIGLLETILPDYYKTPEYILPLERDFCGTFLGDIKCFKIYNGMIDYSTIKNYLS